MAPLDVSGQRELSFDPYLTPTSLLMEGCYAKVNGSTVDNQGLWFLSDDPNVSLEKRRREFEFSHYHMVVALHET